MNVQHEPRRHAIQEGESNAEPIGPQDGEVESTSTRVLLQGNSTLECESCDGSIQQGIKYKCVTVRHGPGEVSELHFCDEDCLASLQCHVDPAAGAVYSRD